MQEYSKNHNLLVMHCHNFTLILHCLWYWACVPALLRLPRPSRFACVKGTLSDQVNVNCAEVIDGVGYTRRKERLDKLFKDEEKKKRFIHLVCRIKGEKVYDDKVEVKDIDVKVEDAELVVETIVKKVKLEIKENV